MEIKDIIGMIPALALFIGVPLLIMIRRRRLARMTPVQKLVHYAEEQRWHDEMMDPTNLSGWTNPDSGVYAGRHDD